MALEAMARFTGDTLDYKPTVKMLAGEMRQLPDGRACYAEHEIAAGVLGSVKVSGVVRLAKTADIAFLNGGRAYWDVSAGTATYKRDYGTADFYAGLVVEDVAGTEGYVHVDLNRMPVYTIDLLRDIFDTVVVLTAGTPSLLSRGGYEINFSATAEAQKVDMLSRDNLAVDVPVIAEFIFTMIDDGDAAAIDFNIGMANATHASDADAITESIFLHTDGDNTQVNLESDDGTTEVAATDSTVDYVLGTPVEFWIDKRTEDDAILYVNGVRRLSGSAFDVKAATGPWKLLVHAEKSVDDTPFRCFINHAAARVMDQVAAVNDLAHS